MPQKMQAKKIRLLSVPAGRRAAVATGPLPRVMDAVTNSVTVVAAIKIRASGRRKSQTSLGKFEIGSEGAECHGVTKPCMARCWVSANLSVASRASICALTQSPSWGPWADKV
jgi:hypothetical protein